MTRWQWRKQGLVFRPNGEGGWMHSHAQVPCSLVLEDRVRVFFAARPHQQLSLPAWVDLHINDLTSVMDTCDTPLMEVGAPGTFDQHGVMPSCVLQVGDELWMYYSGWCREVDVPYNNTIGLAISRDHGKTFQRFSTGPIVGRSRYEPFNASSPFVLHDKKGWQMWYSSGTGFHRSKEGKMEPVYLLKYARSEDGIDWQLNDTYIMPTLFPNEAQTHPTVIYRGDMYHMWFSYRDSEDYRSGEGAYRMGYATSEDGMDWQRQDSLAGIDISAEGWDSRMIAYPHVFVCGGRDYMLYNGNDFGRDGFGLAVAS